MKTILITLLLGVTILSCMDRAPKSEVTINTPPPPDYTQGIEVIGKHNDCTLLRKDMGHHYIYWSVCGYYSHSYPMATSITVLLK